MCWITLEIYGSYENMTTPARAFTAVFITQHLAIGGASEHHNEVRALEDKALEQR